MLDVMRKHSRSFIIYVFFGIIIAVFVINFGPQSAGCTATTSHAARVEGHPISMTLFRQFHMRATGFRIESVPERELVQLHAIVMDQLLVRELLADDALKAGFRISDKEIDDMIVKGRFLSLGQPHPLMRDKDGKFDYDLFAREVQYSFGLNVLKFKEEQRRELLAEKMRQYLAGLVKASQDEVSADYMVRNRQAELNYVRFAPGDYRSQVSVDDAKVKAFLTANKKRVDSYYKDNQTAFQKLPKQVKLQVLEAKSKAKAEAALARIKRGEPFDKVAATESDDAGNRQAGGQLGWRNEDSPGLDPAVNKAIASMKAGALSGVLAGKDRAYVVKVLARRSGDVSLGQAENDIAEELCRTDEAIKLATADAARFIKRAEAGEKLDSMFSSETDEQRTADSPASAPAGAKQDGARSPLKLASTGMFSPSGRFLVPGIGISKDVMDAAFKLKKGQVADHPFVVGQMVYLVAVSDRKEADPGEWARQKDELMDKFIAQKASQVVQEYARKRCEAALRDKAINVNPGALLTPGYVPDKKEPIPTFAPCSSLQERADRSL